MHWAWLLALIPDGTALTASRLAEFYDLPESYLAKLLKALVRAGLLGSSTGPREGFRLARPPSPILAGNASIGSLSRATEWLGRVSAQVQAR